jgi:Flp pilus assembly pilin Flp
MYRQRRIRADVSNELGQTFAEYALLLAALVVGVLLALTWAGLTDFMQAAMDAVTAAV